MSEEERGPLPESVCPVCGYHFDDATCIVKDEAKPRPGDLSLCLKCGEILVFDQELRCKQAGIDDFDGLPGDIDRKMMMAQAMIRKERPIK